jgi:aminopeptidase N
MRTLYAIATFALLACASAHPSTPVSPRTPSTAAGAPDASAGTAQRELPPPRDDGRLPPLARPLRYALSLVLDPRQPTYAGEVTIDVDVPAPTRAIVLHARSVTVTHAVVVHADHRVLTEPSTRRAVGGREADEELVLSMRDEVPAGRARIELRFSGSYAADLRGLFRVQVDGTWYAYSDFEPTDARRAFPCFDEPAFKVPFEVSITTPDDMVALANMPEASRSDDAATHLRTHRFAPTPPTPTYLVSFAAGPFEFHEGPREPVPIRVATVRGRSSLGRLGADTAAAHLRVLGDYFGRPYPYPKLDLVAVPDFGPGAMENPGLITFRDAALLLDPVRAPSRSKYYMYSIVAHELAHQWFGNLVTMAWWDDLWLNEGFATWMGSRVLHTWRPELGARLDEVGSVAWARDNDALASAHAIRVPVTTTSQAMEAFDATTYSKGAAILGMLEAYVGEAPFREGVRSYLNAHAWGNARASDLLSALSDAAGRDLRSVAGSFLDQAGVPLVAMRIECGEGVAPRVHFTQTRFTGGREAEANTRWSIPVCMRYPTGVGAATQERCVLMRDATHVEALELPAGRCPAWVFPNAGAHGYYHVSVAPEVLRALLSGAASLTNAERLDLLTNLDALFSAGDIHADQWLDVLVRLARDADPQVAAAAVGRFGSVEHTLVTEASRAHFRQWVLRAIGPLARTLGWNANPRDSEARRTLRRTVLSTLGTLTDDPWVLQQAELFTRRYLANPSSVDGDVAAIALPIASRKAGIARFEALQAQLARAATPQDRVIVLGALVTFDDTALVRRAYDLVLSDTIRLQDLRALFGRTGASPAHRGLLLAWARDRWDALSQKLGRNSRAIMGTLATQCDDQAIVEAERFLREHLGHMEGVDRSLQQSGDFARRCAATHRREAARAAAVFAGQAR